MSVEKLSCRDQPDNAPNCIFAVARKPCPLRSVPRPDRAPAGPSLRLKQGVVPYPKTLSRIAAGPLLQAVPRRFPGLPVGITAGEAQETAQWRQAVRALRDR